MRRRAAGGAAYGRCPKLPPDGALAANLRTCIGRELCELTLCDEWMDGSMELQPGLVLAPVDAADVPRYTNVVLIGLVSFQGFVSHRQMMLVDRGAPW